MKIIERSEVLQLADYETIRERFRARMMAEKRVRRIQIGPHVTALFENRDTALLQIQEMVRTERITRPSAVQHEIDTYNDLVPGADELSCTMMVEIADKEERDAFLRAAKGLEGHVWLVAGSDRIGARARDRGDADRTTAVHYLKFSLPETLATTLRSVANGSGARPLVQIEIDHPAYCARGAVSGLLLVELGRDLEA